MVKSQKRSKETAKEIVIAGGDSAEMTCGMKFCPFHRWIDLCGHGGAIDSICSLNGEGGNVLVVAHPGAKNAKTEYEDGGVKYTGVRRLPRCLSIKPPFCFRN